MLEAAEMHAVQMHAFPCPVSGGERSVLKDEMRMKKT